jgi:hypothetical protein
MLHQKQGALHDRNNGALLFVIEARDECAAVRITRFLAVSEWTSLAFKGSSTMIRSAPRPVAFRQLRSHSGCPLGK